MKVLKKIFDWITPCKHENIRCIHGDEIVLAGWRRSACMDCPQLFDSLPEICSLTGVKHSKT